jgi:aerobic C4-dicarboxylate transport protein
LPIARVAETRKASLYKSLWVQVLVAIVVAVILGRIDPKVGIAMKPLGGCRA